VLFEETYMKELILDEIQKTIQMCIPEDEDAPWEVDGQLEKISALLDKISKQTSDRRD